MLLHRQTSRIVYSPYYKRCKHLPVTKLCPYLFFKEHYIKGFGFVTTGQHDLDRKEIGGDSTINDILTGPKERKFTTLANTDLVLIIQR
jgi:hypothetical protein